MNILELLATDNYIIVNKTLIRQLGLETAIMLGELCSEYLYYQKEDMLEDDWFYSTIDNIEYNTGLSNYQQNKAFEQLISLDIIQIVVKGIPARRYIKIDEEQVFKYLKTSFKKINKQVFKKLKTNINNNNKNNNKKTISKDIAKKFIEPTLEEIQDYIKEKDMNVDAKTFYDYFTVSDWVDSNGKKVKNWKQKLITWNNHAPKKKSISDKNKEFFAKLDKEIKEERNE